MPKLKCNLEQFHPKYSSKNAFHFIIFPKLGPLLPAGCIKITVNSQFGLSLPATVTPPPPAWLSPSSRSRAAPRPPPSPRLQLQPDYQHQEGLGQQQHHGQRQGCEQQEGEDQQQGSGQQLGFGQQQGEKFVSIYTESFSESFEVMIWTGRRGVNVQITLCRCRKLASILCELVIMIFIQLTVKSG